jgi:hypothetical protein
MVSYKASHVTAWPWSQVFMKNYFFDRSSPSTFHKAGVPERNSFEHPWQ